MTFEEIYKKRGLEYKPFNNQQIPSTQDTFAQIKARRTARQKAEEQTQKFEGMFAEGEKLHQEAVDATGWKRIVKETIKGIPDAAPLVFKTMATPDGIRSMGRGAIKGLSLGWLDPETPEEANEIEKAIEEGWKIGGHFGAFLSGEQALKLAFKTPAIAAKLGAAAPKIAFISSWMGTSQLDKEMRGAGFEERAKRAAYDAATILAFEGLGYGLGKAMKGMKKMNIPKIANQKAIDFYFRDMPKQLEHLKASEAAKIVRGLNVSKVKTIDEALKLVQKSLTPEMLNAPAIKMTIEGFAQNAKKSIPSYTKVLLNKLLTKGKPLIKDKAMLPAAKLLEKLKPTKFEPKLKPIEKPLDFKITPKAEIKALQRIQKDFPGIESISKRIKSLETETKIPTIKISKPSVTAEGYSKWLKKQPEAVKEYKTIQTKIAKIEDVIVKKEFIKTEKLKFETKYSEKYYKALPKMKLGKPKTTSIEKARALSFNPKNLLKPVSHIIKKETDKIVKRSNIAKILSEKLNVPIRRGKFRQKALGIYKPSPKVVRIKKGGIGTISHEVGHYLDDTLGLSGTISKKEMIELTSEYAPKPLSRLNIKGKKKEALAEFIRFYVTEPIKAQKKAPVYSSYFEEIMKRFPEVKEVLMTARQDYKRWLEMPHTAKVMSNISSERKKEGFEEKIFKNIKEFYIDIKDDLYPIKLFQNLAKKYLGDIPSWELPYMLSRLTRGWLGKANTFLEKGTLEKVYWTKDAKLKIKGKSLREILRPIARKKAVNEFNAYLVNLRILELSKGGITTGISKHDALVSFKELNKKYPEFAETAKEIYKFQDDVLIYGFESGLYSAELLGKIKKKNQFYIPFFRVLEEAQAKGYFGKGYVNVANELKRMKGSELDIVNPLESVVKNTYAIINASERNTIGVAMANLAGQHHELGRMFEKVSIPMAKVATIQKKDFSKKLITDFEKIFGFKTQEMEGIIDIFRPSMFLPKDNVLTVLRGGKKHYFQVDPMIYKSLASLDREQAGLALKLLSAPTHWLRAGAILTPEFMIRNPLRDLMGAFVYSKYGFYTPIDFVKGMYSLVKKDDKYWLWRASGGEHSMFVSMDREYLQKSLSEVMVGKGFKGYAKNPLEALRALSEFSETPTRLGEFRKGLAKMDDPLKAAYASREITLDFAKMGHAGKAINNLVVFANANFESWDKLVRAFKHHPTRTTTRVVMGITIPSILLYANNRKDPRWKEIPQWQKDLSWIVFTKNPNDIGWDKMTMAEKKEASKMINSIKYGIYRIPKPFQLGMLFGTIPERILESIDNDDPKAIDQLAENLLSSQSPGITPTILEPLLENWSNYDFFLDRSIVPESKTGLPAEAQYTAYTSEMAKILGKTLNYSPAKIENLFVGYFGGLGKHSINVVDDILKKTGIVDKIDPEAQMADKAIVKAFLIRRPIGSSSESVNRFYDKYKKYESKEQLLKQYYTNNEMEKYYAYKKKYPELYMSYDFKRKTLYSEPARFYRKVAARISELRKIEAKIYAHKTMDATEKRVRMTNIDIEITRLARQGVDFDIKK